MILNVCTVYFFAFSQLVIFPILVLQINKRTSIAPVLRCKRNRGDCLLLMLTVSTFLSFSVAGVPIVTLLYLSYRLDKRKSSGRLRSLSASSLRQLDSSDGNSAAASSLCCFSRTVVSRAFQQRWYQLGHRIHGL